MLKDVRISSIQLFFLIIGFLFGSAPVFTPSNIAGQDNWLAFSTALIGGMILLCIYLPIALLNKDKTFIEILKQYFGKVLGSIIGIFYIWYFLYIAASLARNFGGYMGVVVYPETPVIFITISFLLVMAYAVRGGLEIIARLSELLIPIFILIVLGLFFVLMPLYDFKNLFPFLEHGISPVLKAAFSELTLTFGECIALLMIFPALNKREDLVKTSLLAFLAAGVIFLLILFRDLSVLGSNMLQRVTFPSQISAKLVPGIQIDPFIAANLLIGVGIKIAICTYGAVVGIAQIFNVDEYKPFVLPIAAIIVSLSNWIFGGFSEMVEWTIEIAPYYSIPFQIIIPGILLLFSLFKKKESNQISA